MELDTCTLKGELNFYFLYSSSLDECGIVAQVSTPLAQAEISTYYISTFYTDHTLVRASLWRRLSVMLGCGMVSSCVHVLATALLHYRQQLLVSPHCLS